MKATNLSIVIPYKGCDKNCPYCISKMTGYEEVISDTNYLSKLNKARKIAEMAEVTSISLTGKGEPLLNIEYIEKIGEVFKDFPIEVQTNGIKLLQYGSHFISRLYNCNIDTIAISIDSFKSVREFEYVVKFIKSFGMTTRFTLNLLPDIYNRAVIEVLDECSAMRIDQLSFREVTIPNNEVFINSKMGRETSNWIKSNIDRKLSKSFIKELNSVLKDTILLRELPYGAKLHIYKNMMITYFEYCIQDKSSEDDIRSLIYYEDGHMSTTWYGSNFGRIF